MVLFWRAVRSYADAVIQLPTPVEEPPAEVLDVPAEVSVMVVPTKVPNMPSATWWPSIQPQVQALAAEVTGRAFVDSWAMPEVGDPSVFDEIARKATDAVASVAADPEVAGADRTIASGHLCRIVEVVGEHHEHAAVRRDRWLDRLGTVVATLVGAALLAKLLQPKETWR